VGGVLRLGGVGGALGVEGMGRGLVGLGIISSTRPGTVGGIVTLGGGVDCATLKLGSK
jgi:hypothetical protein